MWSVTFPQYPSGQLSWHFEEYKKRYCAPTENPHDVHCVEEDVQVKQL
jgi:hypothetical protein